MEDRGQSWGSHESVPATGNVVVGRVEQRTISEMNELRGLIISADKSGNGPISRLSFKFEIRAKSLKDFELQIQQVSYVFAQPLHLLALMAAQLKWLGV